MDEYGHSRHLYDPRGIHVCETCLRRDGDIYANYEITIKQKKGGGQLFEAHSARSPLKRRAKSVSYSTNNFSNNNNNNSNISSYLTPNNDNGRTTKSLYTPTHSNWNENDDDYLYLKADNTINKIRRPQSANPYIKINSKPDLDTQTSTTPIATIKEKIYTPSIMSVNTTPQRHNYDDEVVPGRSYYAYNNFYNNKSNTSLFSPKPPSATSSPSSYHNHSSNHNSTSNLLRSNSRFSLNNNTTVNNRPSFTGRSLVSDNSPTKKSVTFEDNNKTRSELLDKTTTTTSSLPSQPIISSHSNFAPPADSFVAAHSVRSKGETDYYVPEDDDSEIKRLNPNPIYDIDNLLEGYLLRDGVMSWYSVMITKKYPDCSYDVICFYDNKYYYNVTENHLREVMYHEGEYVEYRVCEWGYLRGYVMKRNIDNTYNIAVDKNEFKSVNTRNLKRINNRKQKHVGYHYHANDVVYVRGANPIKAVVMSSYTDRTYIFYIFIIF